MSERAHWAVENPGLADQLRGEALAARASLGFDKSSNNVSPSDIRHSIETLKSVCSDGFVPISRSVLEALADPALVKRALGKLSPRMAKDIGCTAEEVSAIEALYYAYEPFDEYSDKPEERWINISERHPDISDGDERCSLWVSGTYTNTGNRFVKMAFVGEALDLVSNGAIDFFMPTGLKRPQPPQEGEGDE